MNVDTGDVELAVDYTPFGQIVGEGGGLLERFPFRFAGGLWDEATGFLRFGARDYDPAVGRWTAKDPALFGGGTPNLYEYVTNSPVGNADPTGEFLNSCTTPSGLGLCGLNCLTVAIAWAVDRCGRLHQRRTACRRRTESPVASGSTVSQVPAATRGGHREKLEAFRQNPDAFDNRGFLRNAPSQAIRERIIQRRIRHLESEIRAFETQIERLISGGLMQVTTKQLRAALSAILDHLEEVGQSEVEIDSDFYWDTPSDGRYDSYQEPTDHTVGQLSDDWCHIARIALGEERPIRYSLVWAASVLRALGENYAE